MIPTIGTIREERSVTRRRNAKNTMVPTNAATIAPIIRALNPASGARIIMSSNPSPAHSVVPVVVGSTNRFWVSNCMTSPDMAIAAPARTRATVRGIRVRPRNCSPWASERSATPVTRESPSSPRTTSRASQYFQSRATPARVGRCAVETITCVLPGSCRSPAGGSRGASVVVRGRRNQLFRPPSFSAMSLRISV